MSAVKNCLSLLKLPIAIFFSIAGWLLITPVALMMPRRCDWVAVIGRQDGRFLDNAKYFFLQAAHQESKINFAYITERSEVAEAIRNSGLNAMLFPSFRGIWFLLRCNIAVVDESSWYRKSRFFLLRGAKIVQLWHGVGFKLIEDCLWANQVGRNAWFSHPIVQKMRMIAYAITGRRVRYAAVLATSKFYRNEVFSLAFRADNFWIAGYPRNDFSQSLSGRMRELAWWNVDNTARDIIKIHPGSNRKLVLIAPTFRDAGSIPMQLDISAVEKINEFAEKFGFEFIFKFHPSEKNIDHISGSNFHICTRDSDIYPIFPYASALITDYSSISMDFLHTDKPICFFIPENDDYVLKDRQLQFDPRLMMPGAIAGDWQSMLEALARQLDNDEWASERAALRLKAFDEFPQEQAVSRLLNLMSEQGWLKKYSSNPALY